MGRARALLVLLALLPAPLHAAAPPPRPSQRGVVVANWAPRPIREIYLSPASSQDWGVNRLDERALRVGDDVRLAYGGACLADLRVVFDTGGAEERHDLELCGHPFVGVRPGWTTADDPAGLSPPALVAVLNRTGRPIHRLYLYPDGASAEGADRLGRDVLPDGSATDVLRPIAATCDFSLHTVLDDGREQRRDGIDLCRYSGVIVEPRPASP